MKRFVVLLLAVVGIWAGEAWGQVEVEWERMYGGASMENCMSLIPSMHGGFLLSGFSFSFGASVGASDFWLVKIDEQGDSLWSHTYGGRDMEYCFAVRELQNGELALAGWTQTFAEYGYDAWLVRADENGDSLWSRTYSWDFSTDLCQDMTITNNEEFVLAGTSWSAGDPGGNEDGTIVRIDNRGDTLWTSRFFGHSWSEFRSVIPVHAGGYILAGAKDSDFWLVRINEIGEALWDRTYGDDNIQECESVVETPDGGFLLLGRNQSAVSGDSWMYVLRTDGEGDPLWNRRYGRGYEWGQKVIALGDGGFLLGGGTNDLESRSELYYLVRIDEDGDSLWSMGLGVAGSHVFKSMIQTEDGGYLLGGQGSPREGEDNSTQFYIIKTSPDPMYIFNQNSLIFPDFFALSAYPNPFNGIVNLNFRAARPGYYAVEMIDPTGRKVARLFDGFATAGENKVTWNAAGMAAGEYYIRFDGGQGGSAVKPVVLVK